MQSYLAVVVPLYLLYRGFSPFAIGVLVTCAAGTGALLSVLAGFAADRYGRKVVLITLSLAGAAAGALFALNGPYAALVAAGALGSIGRGGGAASGGAFGPYYPAEQALLAERIADHRRTALFGMFSFVGVIAGALGSLVSAAPEVALRFRLTTRGGGYDAVFWLTAALGLVLAASVLPIPESRAARRPAQHRAPLSPRTRRLLVRLGASNATNGLAVGFLGPILTLWFHLRFGAGEVQIGTLFFLMNLVGAVPYLHISRIVRMVGGAVRTIVSVRIIACVLLAVVPFMPTFWTAGALYLVRMLFNVISLPVRQSFVMGVVPPEERSRVAGLSNFPAQVLQMVGPAMAGAMFENFWLGAPLLLASALQLVNAGLYWTFFRGVLPPEEQKLMRPPVPGRS